MYWTREQRKTFWRWVASILWLLIAFAYWASLNNPM